MGGALLLAALASAGAPDAMGQSPPADGGTTQSARQIVAAAIRGDAAEREAAAGRLEELGDVAVPALIEAKARPNSLETRKWAIAVLEAMNKKVPGEAVQTKDGALLAEVLRAYGKTRDLDALGAVFAFANSDRTPVREAARDAIKQYGNDALPKLRETYAIIKNGAAPETWGAADLERELFRLMDHERLRDLYTLFDDALAKAKGDDSAQAAQLEPAVALLDQVFARAPTFDRRGEAIPIYVRYARSLEDHDVVKAQGYYRRAERLAPEGSERDRISSAIAGLEAHELMSRGIVDREGFQRALTLDPDNATAKADLTRLDDEAQSKASHLRWIVFSVAAIVVLIAAALLFLYRGARTRAAPHETLTRRP